MADTTVVTQMPVGATMTQVAPMTVPVMKAIPQPMNYNQEFDARLQKISDSFQSACLQPGMTAEQQQATLQSAVPTVQLFVQLINEHLRPLVTAAASTAAAVPSQFGGAATAVAKKPLTDWQIYLKYAKDIIPGYAEAENKMQLVKDAYAQTSTEEKTALRQQYQLENPGAVVNTAPKGTGKGKRAPTGFSLFTKAWYASYKEQHPGSSGLHSQAVSVAWKALGEEEQAKWNAHAKGSTVGTTPAQTAPVAVAQAAPVDTTQPAPVATAQAAPVVTAQAAPVVTAQAAPVAAQPVTTAQVAPVADATAQPEQ